MTNQGWRQGAGRFLRDFGLVLALFWGIAYVTSASNNHAHAVSLPKYTRVIHDDLAVKTQLWMAPSKVQLRVSREARAAHTRAMVLLSFGIAGLAALNLAFLRHLRRVYASPRRGVWRRG